MLLHCFTLQYIEGYKEAVLPTLKANGPEAVLYPTVIDTLNMNIKIQEDIG